MKKGVLTLILIIISFSLSYAQRGYFIQDTTLIVGVKIIKSTDRDNSQFIKVKNNDVWVQYNPEDILEFGLKKNIVFVSFKVNVSGQVKSYFLKRIVKGRYNVYHLDVGGLSNFYINSEKDPELVQIPKDSNDRIRLLRNYVHDSKQSLTNLSYLKLSENSLTRFFTDYNNNSNSHLPRKRYGIKIGLNNYTFSTTDNDAISALAGSLDSKIGISASTFFDIPITTSNYSIEGGIGLQNFNGSNTFSALNTSYDIVANHLRLNLPIFIKHTFYNLKKSLYIKSGVILSRSLRDKSALYKYTELNNEIFIEVDKSRLFGQHHLSFSAGAGMVFNYDSKHSFVIDLAYSKSSNIQSSDGTLSINEVSISLSILF